MKFQHSYRYLHCACLCRQCRGFCSSLQHSNLFFCWIKSLATSSCLLMSWQHFSLYCTILVCFSLWGLIYSMILQRSGKVHISCMRSWCVYSLGSGQVRTKWMGGREYKRRVQCYRSNMVCFRNKICYFLITSFSTRTLSFNQVVLA